MVIDSSVLIAILESEPEAEQLADAIEHDHVRCISAASVVEATIVIENRRGKDGVNALNLLMDAVSIEIIPVTAKHASIACQAYRDFGKGGIQQNLILEIVFHMPPPNCKMSHCYSKETISTKQI